MVEEMEDVVDLISVWCLDEDFFHDFFFFFGGGVVLQYDITILIRYIVFWILLVHVIILFVGWLFNFGHCIYEADQCLGLIKAADSWHVSTEVAPSIAWFDCDQRQCSCIGILVRLSLHKTWHKTRGCDEYSMCSICFSLQIWRSTSNVLLRWGVF